MSVQYKFKNTIDHDAVKFDGVYISAADLKQIIIQQKKLGHSELKVENEDTGQTYSDDQLIPKNTNIIVSRLPMANSNKRTRQAAAQPYPARFSGNVNSHNNGPHQNHRSQSLSASSSSSVAGTSSAGTIGSSSDGISGGREAMELVSNKNLTEEERKKYIQSQSTKDFDPTLYAKSNRGGGGMGGRGGHRHFTPRPGYVCRKCGTSGHSIYDCKVSALHKAHKRCSGIPRNFLMKVDPKEKGALLTSSGEYVVPIIDREAYQQTKVEKPPVFD